MADITLEGTPYETNGNVIQEGSPLPDFSLMDKDLNPHSLEDYKGKKIILSTNPSLDTSVCLTMAKKMNDLAQMYSDIRVIYVSSDLPFAMKRVCQNEHITNVKTLSLMGASDYAKDLGLLISSGPLTGLVARSLIVTDENHKIVHVELVKEITQEPDVEKALKAL